MLDAIMSELPIDPVGMIMYLVSYYEGNLKSENDPNKLARFYALMRKMLSNNKVGIEMPKLDATIFNNLRPHIDTYLLQAKIAAADMEVEQVESACLSGIKITAGQVVDIQERLNGLRDAITESDLFDEKHKQRILKKVELLQYELHKKITNYDSMLVNTLRLGRTLGGFGKDSMPFVKMVKELFGVLQGCDKELEALPLGEIDEIPMLLGNDEMKNG
jgi:hypothetical protein